VSTKKEIVVQDACILFDLIDLGLISVFFDLDYDVMTTPQVMTEVLDGDQMSLADNLVNNGRLKVDDKGDLTEIQEILIKNSGLSFADSSVLELAIRVNGTVLSSDLKLRNATSRNGLTVRGVLWIVEELYAKSLLSSDEAISKLNHYQGINDRAPRAEIKALVDRIQNQVLNR
jgi:predicted nucleic acid-binding protein